VSFTASDASEAGIAVERSITVTPVNDPPQLAAIETGALTYAGGDPPTAITSTLEVIDPDDANLTGAMVQITENYVDGEDVLGFSDTASILGVWTSVDGTMTLTGAATPGEYQAALRSVTYVNASGDPDTSLREVTVIASDPQDGDPVTRSISVVAMGTIFQDGFVSGTVCAWSGWAGISESCP